MATATMTDWEMVRDAATGDASALAVLAEHMSPILYGVWSNTFRHLLPVADAVQIGQLAILQLFAKGTFDIDKVSKSHPHSFLAQCGRLAMRNVTQLDRQRLHGVTRLDATTDYRFSSAGRRVSQMQLYYTACRVPECKGPLRSAGHVYCDRCQRAFERAKKRWGVGTCSCGAVLYVRDGRPYCRREE